ncbi:O-antigen ligase family protein [Vibrio owensii]|uniref:O-antigen ligase family protein n=1 Tax=Vibrio owensii TaxID=696485 RepID=UPI0018F14A09|nr:O-antigen ligase family protein [Vibrio owensii]
MFINERTIVGMALALFFVDNLSGMVFYFVGVDVKLSLVYKFVFLTMCLFYLAKNSRLYFLMSVNILVGIFTWSILINISDTPEYAMLDFAELYKLFSTILVFLCFSCFKYSNVNNYLQLSARLMATILIINIVATYAGFGEFSYGSYGAIGFFQGGNALSGIIVITSTYFLTKYIRKGLVLFFMGALFWFVIAFLIGTKSAMLSVLILTFVVPFLYSKAKTLMLLIPFACIITPLLVFVSEIVTETGVYSRLLYFYENGGLIRVIFSGRNEFLVDVWDYFSRSNVKEIVFGLGVSGMREFEKVTIEMDFFDVMFRFGMISLLFYSISMAFVLYKSKLFGKCSSSNDEQLQHFVLISGVLLVIISFLSGHIIFNGMITCIWGTVLASYNWKLNQNKLARAMNQ